MKHFHLLVLDFFLCAVCVSAQINSVIRDHIITTPLPLLSATRYISFLQGNKLIHCEENLKGCDFELCVLHTKYTDDLV